MTKSLRRLLFALLAHTAGLLSLTAQPLETVVARAIEENPDVLAGIEQLHAAGFDVRIAKGAFLPTVTAGADGGTERRERDGFPTTDQNRGSANVEAALPLFRGFGNQAGLERADAAQQATYHRTVAIAEDIALRTAQAYLELLRAERVVELSRQNLTDHEATYDLVKQRSDQGVSDQSDLTQITGRLARAKASLANSLNNLRDAETTMQQLAGMRPSGLVAPASWSARLPGSRSALTNQALEQQVTLLAAQEDVSAAEAGIAAQRSVIYPQVDLVANGTWRDGVEGFKGREDEYRVLVRARLDLYQGGQNLNRVRQAESRTESARQNLEKVRRQVLANAHASWDAFELLAEAGTHLQEYVNATIETSDLYHQQFTVGRRTLLDLLDSQNELFNAQKVLIRNQYDLLGAELRVLASMSELTPALGINLTDRLDEAEGS